MTEVLLSSGEKEDTRETDKRSKLILLEDADEFVTEDAKERIGQSLSRFLNIADGIIGQGLDVLFIVTTNTQLKKIHPAFARDGRCGAIIEFNKLAQEQSTGWLNKHESDEKFDREMTIASLYAALNRKKISSKDKMKIGF